MSYRQHYGYYSRTIPESICSFIVDTWALKGLPYHDFGVHVHTIKLHGAFGHITAAAVNWCPVWVDI